MKIEQKVINYKGELEEQIICTGGVTFDFSDKNVSAYNNKDGKQARLVRIPIAVTDFKGDTDYYSVTLFGKTAEAFIKLGETGKIKKGMKILVVGRPEIQEYTDKDGNHKTSKSIVGTSVEVVKWMN